MAQKFLLSAIDILARALSVAKSLEVSVVPADDGGLSLDFESPDTGREVDFVVPQDGSVRYFSARDAGGRAAGVVVDDDAVVHIARWMAGLEDSFPTSGVAIGKSSRPRLR